jgi:hypothetical protein
MLRDILMYVSVSLFHYVSEFIYVYVSLLSVCLSVFLSKGLSLFPPGHIVQTKMTRSIVANCVGSS